MHPRRNLLQMPSQTTYLGRPYICECGDCVSVERRESHLVEVDEPDAGYARAGQGGGTVATDAAATNYDYEGIAELGEAGVGEEDAVAG